jgi:hypothetical protein
MICEKEDDKHEIQSYGIKIFKSKIKIIRFDKIQNLTFSNHNVDYEIINKVPQNKEIINYCQCGRYHCMNNHK